MITVTGLNLDYHVDYHSKEADGYWIGEVAKLWGQSGVATPEVMRRLRDGFSLDGNRKLVQNAGHAKRHGGIQVTVNAPKDVSLLAIFPELESDVLECHRLGVEAVVKFIEETACFTRLGKGGYEIQAVRPPIVRFSHLFARSNDIHVHDHLLFFGIGVGPNGKTNSLVSREIYRAKMAAGAIYRAELAFQLRKRLGIELQRERSWFRVVGVPKKVVDLFSKRRKDIERALRSRGVSSARASEVATLVTRPPKKLGDRESHFAGWRAAAEAAGFGWRQAKSLLNRSPLVPVTEAEQQAVVDKHIEEISKSLNHFSERGLVRRVAEAVCPMGWSATDIRTAVKQSLNSPQIVSLQVEKGPPEFTPHYVLAEEKQILATAARLSKERRHEISEKTLDRILAKYTGEKESLLRRAFEAGKSAMKSLTRDGRLGPRRKLSEEHEKALRWITRQAGDACVTLGPPGSAKSTLCRALREAYEAERNRVIAMTPTGKAAQGLEEATGIRTTTIHRAIADLKATWKDTAKHHTRQLIRAATGKHTWRLDRVTFDKNTVVIMDEAGQANSEQVAFLLREIERARGKIIFVGDTDQTQPIARTAGLDAIAKRIGKCELTQIVRQQDEWARDAVKSVGRGESEAALKAFSDRGLVHVAADREAAIDALVEDWKIHAAPRPESSIVLAPTRRDVDLLNKKIQASRHGPIGLGLVHVTANGDRFHGGDRILFTQNSTWLGVKNGSLGTVETIDVLRRRLEVRLDSSRKLITVPLKHYEQVKPGYSMTVAKAQGLTCEKAFLLVGGKMQDRELSYVMVSRARQETRIYADRFEAGIGLEGLAKQMNTSHKKRLAHDVGHPVEKIEPQKPRLSP